MAKIKVGVTIQPQHTTWASFRQAWLAADALGVDSLWTWDHFFPLSGDPDGPHFEGWTVLAALGPATRRPTIGCLVHSMSYRNPALLSAMAKTLDHALDGRFILGLGAGWFERDYQEYGYEFGTAGERLSNLERGIEVIKERWERDNPRPVHGTIPIMVGGSGEKVTLRITARHADLWNGSGPPENLRHKNDVLDGWCAKVGRDPRAIERTVSIDDPDLDRLDDYVAAGADHFIYRLAAPFRLESLERLVSWRDSRGQ